MVNKEKEDLLNEIMFIAKNEVRAEVYKEINKQKKDKTLCTERAKLLYDKFKYDNPIVLKQLKKSLPLRVSLVNKITIIGMALLYEDIIEYAYCFNDDYRHEFVYKPRIEEMEKWK